MLNPNLVRAIITFLAGKRGSFVIRFSYFDCDFSERNPVLVGNHLAAFYQ